VPLPNGALPYRRYVRIGLVCSTIGRAESIDDLLGSLHGQSRLPAQVVIVDQGDRDDVRVVVKRWEDRLPVQHIPCDGRGLSHGRNRGLDALEEIDVIGFPDDDLFYPPGLLELLHGKFAANTGLAGVCGRVVFRGASGSRMHSAPIAQALDRTTVWALAMEGAMFVRSNVIASVGKFDETLGVGGSTRWQSGEGTELLIRALDAGLPIEHHPDCIVEENDPRVFLTRQEYFAKSRRYARGTGRVHRMHYSWTSRARIIYRPLGAALLALARWDIDEVKRYGYVALGRAEGVLLDK